MITDFSQACVIVADDSVDTRTRIVELLAEQTTAIVIGCGTHDLEQLLATIRAQLVVLDPRVRDESTFTVLRRLRMRFPACILVAVSNHATVELRRRLLSAGVDVVLDKSMEIERLLPMTRALKRTHDAA